MKNIQVIDGATNCYYPIYSATQEEFDQIFPAERQDIEFIGDVITRLGLGKADEIFNAIWKRRCDKKTVQGIHGTLFYELLEKKQFYPTKKESEMTNGDFDNDPDEPDEATT